MAIQSLTYHDLPAAKRRVSASKAIQQLRERINTTQDPELVADYKAQLSRFEQWAQGNLEQGA